MAYDEGLAQRIREMLEDRPGASEKRMFGGLCFLIHGNMVAGVVGSELMVRVGAEAYDEALAHPDAREMDFTGRALRGMVYVAEDGIAEDADLRAWLERGLRYAESLPPKQPNAKKKSARKATRKRA